MAGQESQPSNIVQADINVGINDPVPQGDISMIKMGPNPFNGHLNIDISIERETVLDIRVTDISGKPVATIFQSEVKPGIYHYVWNGTGKEIPAGLYLVNFKAGKANVKTFKLIVPETKR